MSDLLEYKLVKTNTTHKCFACLSKIPPKTKALYQTVVDSGQFYHTYMCETCQRYAQEIDQPSVIKEGAYAEGTKHQEQIEQFVKGKDNE